MNVLVAIDDSSYSDAAVASIAARQWPADTKFLLFSVVPDYDKLGMVLSAASTQKLRFLEEEQEREAIFKLLARCAELRRALPEVTVTFAVGYGHPAEEIIDTAISWGAHLIVMGSHGRRNVQLYAFGSVTSQVIEKIPCSLEIIRVFNRTGKSWQDQRRVLICFDGSDNSRAALDWVAHSTWSAHQEFAIVSVLDADDDNKIGRLQMFHQRKVTQLKNAALAARQDELDWHVERLRLILPGNPVVGQVLYGDAADLILELAENFSADLIVIGAHGKQMQADASTGSVAKRVACFSRCCVKIVLADETSTFDDSVISGSLISDSA